MWLSILLFFWFYEGLPRRGNCFIVCVRLVYAITKPFYIHVVFRYIMGIKNEEGKKNLQCAETYPEGS